MSNVDEVISGCVNIVLTFRYRECISHGEEKHGVLHISWRKKTHLVWKFPSE